MPEAPRTFLNEVICLHVLFLSWRRCKEATERCALRRLCSTHPLKVREEKTLRCRRKKNGGCSRTFALSSRMLEMDKTNAVGDDQCRPDPERFHAPLPANTSLEQLRHTLCCKRRKMELNNTTEVAPCEKNLGIQGEQCRCSCCETQRTFFVLGAAQTQKKNGGRGQSMHGKSAVAQSPQQPAQKT